MAIESQLSGPLPIRPERRFGASVPQGTTLGTESRTFPPSREVTEALPILVQKGKITLVGKPLIVEKRVNPSSMEEERIQRTSIFFVVANRDDKTGDVDVEADYKHVFNALHDEMNQPVGVSFTHEASVDEYAANPNLRVISPPKFYLRVHPPAVDTMEELVRASRVKDVVELYVLPTEAAAAEMHRRFTSGNRIPVLLVTPDGKPVSEEV